MYAIYIYMYAICGMVVFVFIVLFFLCSFLQSFSLSILYLFLDIFCGSPCVIFIVLFFVLHFLLNFSISFPFFVYF